MPYIPGVLSFREYPALLAASGDAVAKAGFSVCRWSWDLASSPSWRRQPFWHWWMCRRLAWRKTALR
ncbi:hypothetical protein ACNKHP_15210 [Shigella boydii]